MELLIRLIEFIVHSALEQNKRTAAPPISATPSTSQPRAQAGAARQQPAAQLPSRPLPRPVQPLVTRAASQDPLYDDRGWRSALTVLAVIVFIIMIAMWAVYIYNQGIVVN